MAGEWARFSVLTQAIAVFGGQHGEVSFQHVTWVDKLQFFVFRRKGDKNDDKKFFAH